MSAPDVFAALANPVRRRILELLRDQPRTAGGIAAEFELNRPAVSEHLQVLREAGLVRDEPRGRQRVYHLVPGALRPVEAWLQTFEAYWRRRIAALEDTLTEGDRP